MVCHFKGTTDIEGLNTGCHGGHLDKENFIILASVELKI